ncbi:DUF4395 domain-containing protein [Paenibacillus radicis (ex Xue et al. 2023)]|uniref:DUF4395 domain-containing protein n=1 Tax=Paenibacillus radicis (ex Xue et al. 2023) TaxID=2972489 RepID=A0ABT1YF07_9BACL|nr:DUF4395 domain-containing protein [Paenibacillus radicis (ex Xue et al. 2023)]MCR8631780.1 DUF4395 domain-containing protein [Paenibacillus radicis (ex Xue et al. 2023)]
MREIPVPYVRANQAGIVLFVVLAIVLQQPVFIAAIWAIQVIGLWRGFRANLIVRLATPFLASRVAGAQTESAELLRFNNSIAVILLTISLFCFWVIHSAVAGYIAAAMVAIAALIAICGFCVGCFLYYQFKKRLR